MTNSTTETDTVKLLSGTECEIISAGLEVYNGGLEVRLLSLNYKRVSGEWLTPRPTPALFSSKHKTVPA